MSTPEAREAEASFVWPTVLTLPPTAPLIWLSRGFNDMLREPVPSLFYGVVLAAMGWLFTRYLGGAIGLALSTGFLLIGPFLAVGLYDISRRIETGEPVELRPTLTAWRANAPAIGFFALILMLSLAVWMRVSVVLVAFFLPEGVETLQGLLLALRTSPDMWTFILIYMVVGGFLAVFSFATAAVSLPMLLDRKRMDAITAMIVSVNLIRTNPAALGLWAVLIVALVAAGFATWYLGLVVTIPMIGHATWHAYRASLAPEGDG